MKPAADTLDITNSQACGVDSESQLIWPVGVRPLERAASRHSISRAVRLVGVMAFAHSLLFLVIWLLVCSTAGAATTKNTAKKTGFNPDLQVSTFEPSSGRDPFGKVGFNSSEAKALPGAPIALQLEGILYQSSSPSAIVNGRLLTLDKTVTLPAGTGEVKVRAVEITRDHVVVEAGGQKIDLRLNSQNAATRP
jgi:hypothetical protein